MVTCGNKFDVRRLSAGSYLSRDIDVARVVNDAVDELREWLTDIMMNEIKDQGL